MTSTRKIKVWNKEIYIQNVPDEYTDEQLIEWTKKKLILDGYVEKVGGMAS